MAPRTIDEAARLRLLRDYGVMDTAPDPTLDDIVALASAICEAPIALVSLVDDTRQWFKAKKGIEAQETPREVAFCAHVIVADDEGVFAVPDARVDPRFRDNPLVKGDPNVVFYAGAPLSVEGGNRLGTLCVIDRKPRTLTTVQTQALDTLSKLVVSHLQRRRDEAERVAADAQHYALLTSIGDAVVSTDGEGRITFSNPVADALAGWTTGEAHGVPIGDALRLVDAKTRESRENPALLALRDGVMVALGEPAILVRRDGSEIVIDDGASPVRNANGDITGAVLVFRDITQVKRLEAERRRLEGELDRAVTLSLDLIASTRAGRFIRVNPAFETVLGWTEAEILAIPIADLVHPEDAERTLQKRLAAARGEVLEGFESRYRHKDGSYRWLSWNAIAENETTYVMGRDVTMAKAMVTERALLLDEQRAAREVAERAALAMDQFLATVSHELRTPLNAILGWTRLLKGGRLPEAERPKAMAAIERNSVAQAQLIEDLLDVSRIIAGKMRLEFAPVVVADVVEAALDVVLPSADAKGVRLEASPGPRGMEIIGDASRLQQVIWNLLTNAIKFTPKGGTVELRVTRRASTVEISVKDDGAGIALDFLPHVFERFRQADGASTRSHQGLGLGLSIVKNITELHGGSVRAESLGIGLGATFVVRLPVERSPGA